MMIELRVQPGECGWEAVQRLAMKRAFEITGLNRGDDDQAWMKAWKRACDQADEEMEQCAFDLIDLVAVDDHGEGQIPLDDADYENGCVVLRPRPGNPSTVAPKTIAAPFSAIVNWLDERGVIKDQPGIAWYRLTVYLDARQQIEFRLRWG